MPVIAIQTAINAPIQLCFNLARDIDVHVLSMAGTNERAVAVVTSGLIGLNEEVHVGGDGFWSSAELNQPDYGLRSTAAIS